MNKKVNLRWAKKVLNAKNFVVMTDKESVLRFRGVDPASFTDILMLHSQAAELEAFMESLKDLQKRHNTAIEKLAGSVGITSGSAKRAKAKPNTQRKQVPDSKRRKIPVKKG
jgi:hypothetical protein